MIVRGTVDVANKAVSSVTTVSGMPEAPAVVIFFARTASNPVGVTDGSVGSGATGHNFGVLTAGGQFTVHSLINAGSPEVVDRRHVSGVCHDDSITASGTGAFVGALTSDGFTLTCTDATSTNNFLHYVAIGGPGVEAEVGTITAPASPGVVDYDLGMKPHMLLHWSLGTLNNSSSNNYHIAMGAVAYDLTQGSQSISSNVLSPGTSLYIEYCTDQEGFSYNQNGVASLLARGVATAWLPNGVQIDWAAASSEVFHYLALRGVTTQLVGMQTASGAGNVASVTGMPWQPDAGLVFSTMFNGTFHTPGTPTSTTGTARIARFSFGAWCGTSDKYLSSFTRHINSVGFGGMEVRHGRGAVAGFRTQLTGNPGVLYDLTAINSDGFDITTSNVSGGSASARPLLTLAFLDQAPIERRANPHYFGGC